MPVSIIWKVSTITNRNASHSNILASHAKVVVKYTTVDFLSSSNYREENVKHIKKTYNDNYQVFFSIKHKFWARKRNVSMRRFFYAPKTYIII